MKEESINSRNIPSPIQREVRQRCGFGCVICGLPLYEYEHMKEWALVKRHVADEITLLCDQHHREKTSGLLPKEVVIESNKNPFNLKQGVSKPYDLHYNGDSAKVVIGNLTFIQENQGYGTELIPIMIDNIPIIGIILADGHFLLNMVLFNEFNTVLLIIKENQLIYNINVFDIQLVGKTLTIREKSRKIIIEIRFETPNTVIISKGILLANGVKIFIAEGGISINNDNVDRNISNILFNARVGVAINSAPGAAIALEDINRYST